jgi:multidrug efflux pump subunit AcrB
MSFLTRFSLKNAAAIFILCIMIISGGIYSTSQIKKETMPDITIPIVAVITAYPGASPTDIQDKVTKPLESLVSSVEGIKSVNSTSSENVSSIIVQFDYSEDMEDAQRKVEAAIKTVSLPNEVIDPKIMRINFNSLPVVSFSISNNNITAADLEQKVRENVLPGLSGINGVGQVQLASETLKSVYIKLIPSKLKEYNMTSQYVTQLIQANNVSFPTGSLNINDTIEPIRVTGKFNSLDELKRMQLPVTPSTQETMKSAFSQVGSGVENLGKAVGQLGQGLSGLSQATSGQIKLLTAIQETQSQLLAATITLNDANQTLKNVNATPEQKQIAKGTIAKVEPSIQIAQVALKQMRDKLKQIQLQTEKATSASGNNQNTSTTSPTSGSTPQAQTVPVLKKVALGEIAEITMGTGNATSISRTNGSPSVIVQVLKTQEANTVDVSEAVQKKLSELKNLLPKDTETSTTFDQAVKVNESINGMLREGILGALFAFLVILLFLRNIRTTIIACISIPLSILITLIFLKQLNITLNIMTLGGLSVAVGRIVDDSIVVIENIYRHLNTDKVRNADLIKLAAKEVTSAITSSTLTTVAVFIPITLFVGGFAGIMFKPFAYTVALSLLASLIVAVTVIPLLSKVLLLKSKKIKDEAFHEGKLMKKYQSVLKWSLNHKLVVLSISLGLLLGSLSLLLIIPTSFITEEKEKAISVSIDYPAGTDIQIVNKKAEEIEKILAENKDVGIFQTTLGTSGSLGIMSGGGSQSSGNIKVKLHESANVDEVVKDLTNKFKVKADKAKIDVVQTNLSGGSMEGSNNIEVVVKGNDIKKIKESAILLTKELSAIKGLDRVSNNLSESKPEIAINVDQTKASSFGLSAAQVGLTLRELLNDKTVTTIVVDKSTMDVRMGLKLEQLERIEEIGAIEIQSPLGSFIKISEIAEVKEVPGPVSIFSADGDEYARITGNITEKNSGAVSTRVKEKIAEIELPDGVTTEMGGVTELMGDTFGQLGLAMVVAVFAVYLVMMIALGGAIAPLAILFSLPLAVIGGLVGLFVSGVVLDSPAMIGALMLIGIVVTNAIVLIDRVQRNRKEGISIRESLMEAGRIRMRPILMTAVATIAALIPLAIGISKDALLSQSLAVIVIGGLATSTLLTLIIVPVAYEMLENLKLRLLGKSEIA